MADSSYSHQKWIDLTYCLIVFMLLTNANLAFSHQTKSGFKTFATRVAKIQKETSTFGFFPSGRSPERLFTDDAHPRIVGHIGKRIFLAYTENANLAQAIVLNDNTRAFEFYQTQNYKARSEPVFYKMNNPQTCLACHQSGGPLGTHDTWNEMNEAQDVFGDPRLIERLRKAIGTKNYLGFPVKNIAGNALFNAIRASNRLAQSYRVCANICKDDLDCKKHLIKLGLTHPNASAYINQSEVVGLLVTGHTFESTRSETSPTEQSILSNWPDDGFAYVDWGIPDMPKGTTFDQYRKKAASTLAVSDRLDPATPRSKIDEIKKEEALSWLSDVAFECLGFYPKDAKILMKLSGTRVNQFLESETLRKDLDSWPIGRAKLIWLITEFLPENDENIHSSYNIKNAIDALPIGGIEQAESAINNDFDIEKERPISRRHFQALCIQCHGRSNSEALGDLHLNDPKGFTEYLKKNYQAVAKEIETKSMPEQSAAIFPSNELRKDLVNWLLQQEFLKQPN